MKISFKISTFPTSLCRAAIIGLAARIPERLGAIILLSVFGSTGALAQISGGTDPATILTNIGTFILGPFGQSIAILGIVAIGVSWMFGRASLGLIASVIGGIVIMFGAAFLGKTLVGA